MKVRLTIGIVTALVASLGVVGTRIANAAGPPAIVVDGGETQVAFGYTDAVRQRVWVDSDFDSDSNGVADLIAVDIMRPAATEQGMRVPVIMDDSPYYSTLGRGNESQKKVDDANGLLAQWPLFLDNFFVPRGYAVALVDMTGTNHSTGCPTVQGYTDNMAGVEVIDWLNGRRTAHDKDGNLVTAYWHNGKTGMIGKSYDGALAAAATVTSVQGLATVVDESGPYNYYDYTRSNGVIQRGGHYLASLANTVTDANRRAYCQPVRDNLSANDGDATGDYSPFWDVRNYIRDAANVRASVFAVHGIQDENVRPDHFSKWWYALSRLGVPRKAWILQVGHVDPFDDRRAVWVDTLHRWFDYWLMGVQNGIMSEPQADIETGPGTWETAATWPVPGSTPTQVFLRAGNNVSGVDLAAGVLGLAPATGAEQTSMFTDSSSQTESTMIGNQTIVTPNRRVFLSPTLTKPLRISGTPLVQLNASADQTDTNLGAILVDYGPAFPRVVDNINNNGVTTLTTSDCWGESSPADSACYKQVAELIDTSSTGWRVSKGILDALNRTSLTTPTPLTVGQRYTFSFPLLPQDYTFPAGHQIGIVIVGSYSGYGSTADTTNANITFSLQTSRAVLPIVGGHAAALAAGLAGTEGTATGVGQDGASTQYNDRATFTATVAAQDAAMATSALPSFVSEALPADEAAGFRDLGKPSGTVQFKDGGANLGSPVALSAGRAQLTTSSLSVGAHSITALYNGGGGFNTSVSGPVSHQVTRRSQTIAFAPIPDKAYGDPPFTVSATATSGLPVSFSASGDCSVTGATVSLTGAGSCTVTASQGGDANFNPAPSVARSFAIAPFPFTGFFSPLKNPPTLNVVQAGSSVPVKFSLGGNRGLAIFAAGYPQSQPIACDAQAATARVNATTASSGLTYDPKTKQYTYTWKTDKSWASSCRQLVLRLTDNTSHSALFKLTK